jgi:hypothetical protein
VATERTLNSRACGATQVENLRFRLIMQSEHRDGEDTATYDETLKDALVDKLLKPLSCRCCWTLLCCVIHAPSYCGRCLSSNNVRLAIPAYCLAVAVTKLAGNESANYLCAVLLTGYMFRASAGVHGRLHAIAILQLILSVLCRFGMLNHGSSRII